MFNVSNLKSKIDKLDTGKLETTSVSLSKLSNLVINDVVKKAIMNSLKILIILVLPILVI